MLCDKYIGEKCNAINGNDKFNTCTVIDINTQCDNWNTINVMG